jgi:hypothetical protein
MNLLKKLQVEQELEKKALGQRTLLSDAELQELEEQIQSEARQKLAEHEIYIRSIEEDIETARQYLHIRSWKRTLEILKHLFDDKKVPAKQQAEVHKLYFEAQALMEEARKLDPTVPKFTHFNLPADNVN